MSKKGPLEMPTDHQFPTCHEKLGLGGGKGGQVLKADGRKFKLIEIRVEGGKTG